MLDEVQKKGNFVSETITCTHRLCLISIIVINYFYYQRRGVGV